MEIVGGAGGAADGEWLGAAIADGVLGAAIGGTSGAAIAETGAAMNSGTTSPAVAVAPKLAATMSENLGAGGGPSGSSSEIDASARSDSFGGRSRSVEPRVGRRSFDRRPRLVTDAGGGRSASDSTLNFGTEHRPGSGGAEPSCTMESEGRDLSSEGTAETDGRFDPDATMSPRASGLIALGLSP